MKTQVKFLVNESAGKDLFAYFPEHACNDVTGTKQCYSFVGQHSSCSPEYAEASREATKEEYKDLLSELELKMDYELEVLNSAS